MKLFAALALLLVLAVPAFAGKTSPGSSILRLVLVSDVNGDGLAGWSDTVAFVVSTTATSQPFVNLVCSQNGVQVYSSWKGVFPGSLDTDWNFVLGSGGWTAGAADCTARLGGYDHGRFKVFATLAFSVTA